LIEAQILLTHFSFCVHVYEHLACFMHIELLGCIVLFDGSVLIIYK
jgi:hypothetical protein